MFALVFRFPAGRYHATPWGRHVNEGAVAWPPEPYRILRALIATWHRKADQTRCTEEALHKLIEALAVSDPVYRLPDATHAHTRHYMPQGKLDGTREKTSLVFDAFYRLDPKAELVVAWPDIDLDPETYALAQYLTGLIGYLGRAESIASAQATNAINGPFPVTTEPSPTPGWIRVDTLTPLSPLEYASERSVLLSRNSDKPKSKGRIAFEATVPKTLTEALRVETSQLQAAGWSRPPAGRLIGYSRPDVGPRPPSFVHNLARADEDRRFTVARLILAGRPRPPITDAVKIGEVFRQALMSRARDPIPSVLSGKDAEGWPLRDPEHGHAFFLPEDHDQDGFIDHLVLFASTGLPRPVRQAVESLPRLWINEHRHRAPEEAAEGGRKEWRVALDDFGAPTDFQDSALLRGSRTWVSVTPYLRPLHLKRGDPWEQTRSMVEEECARRGLGKVEVSPDGEERDGKERARAGRDVRIGDRWLSALAFHRFRGRRGLTQPDRMGAALRLTFDEIVVGPVALGFGCHYGLGLFRAADVSG